MWALSLPPGFLKLLSMEIFSISLGLLYDEPDRMAENKLISLRHTQSKTIALTSASQTGCQIALDRLWLLFLKTPLPPVEEYIQIWVTRSFQEERTRYR